MRGGTALIYLYDGCFEGFLTAVFEAYARKEDPDRIIEEERLQYGFEQREFLVVTDGEKARRVERGITQKIGHPAYRTLWTAFLSGDPEKAGVLYRYLRAGFAMGRRIYTSLAHPDVLAMQSLYGPLSREVQKLTGFVRFSRMENGVYYGRIAPENSVVPLLMPHFADRFSDQPFLLHDPVHALAGVYGGGEWYLVETQGLSLPEFAGDEIYFRRMWKRFYESVAVMERLNPKYQRGNMPKRYWKSMVEHTFAETPRTRRAEAPPVRQIAADIYSGL